MAFQTITLSTNETITLTEGVMRGAGPEGGVGPPGPNGPATVIVGHVATSSQLPASGTQGQAYITDDTGHIWSWNTLLVTPAWVDGGRIVGPPANSSIGARRTKTGSNSLVAGIEYIVVYNAGFDFNDADPSGGYVLDAAKSTTLVTAVDPAAVAYYLVTSTIEMGSVSGSPMITAKWQKSNGDLAVDGKETFATVGTPASTITHVTVMRTTEADLWRLKIVSDMAATIVSVVTEWTRLGGGTGPQGSIGNPPVMVSGTASKLAYGANPTVSVALVSPGTYSVSIGVPTGATGAAQDGFPTYDTISGGGSDSSTNPGGTPIYQTDQELPVPDNTQKPYIPYFFMLLAEKLHRLVVSRLTTTEVAARGAAEGGEIHYNLTTRRLMLGTQEVVGGAATYRQIPTSEYGTDAAIIHGASTTRADGSLYFKHDA